MAEKMTDVKIEPEVAGHLAAAMDQPAVPGPAAIAVGLAMAGEQHWPDGNGKKRHPKENESMHGRAGHEAAVNAVHRTGRPQMPHSS
ncbi:hypothetical protein [Arthrobacter sp. HMWF013]|uniref:hypothetical protein n=1 Tax=Arthrobacter sp. HMWF013 TaxID=2056849 RepID=UPI000D375F0E|nr:hypothetical protein [Arthrobacter sp. HMWF013]PTT67281.1 hypothetical protein DBR22_09200 [Arthrobacter sp. HMWF013]